MINLSGRIRSIAILLLSIFCALAVLPSSTPKTANADTIEADKINNLYYFSDSSHCDEFYQALYQKYLPVDHNLYRLSDMHPYSDLCDFYDNGSGITHIKNAYVIVECLGGMNKKDDLSTEEICDFLYYFFEDLKTNNCKIMFINGTDESKFKSAADFLRFADIHVNTDMLSVFIKNIILTAYQDSSFDFRNITFLLDSSFVADRIYNKRNDGLLLYYLIPFLKNIYKEQLMNSKTIMRNFMRDEINVKVYIHIDENIYYSVTENTTVSYESLDDFYYTYLYNEHIYTVGTTINGSEYAGEWNGNVTYLKNTFDSADIKNFLYCQNERFSELGYSGVYACNSATGNIGNILSDFVGEGNIVKYDNYDGVCDISHKDCVGSAHGWILLNIYEYEDLFADDDIWFNALYETDMQTYEYLNAGLDDEL